MKQVTGWHVFALFAFGFGVIIAVNATLAVNAVRSFPGLEVRNSYVASQAFDASRAAQEALLWEVTATLEDNHLVLRIERDGRAVSPEIVSAVFGRATSVAADQRLRFRHRAGAFEAPVEAGPGQWNLRLVALAKNGTRFQQRIVIEVPQ